MPRAVRNFWLKTQVDGRATIDQTGPQGRDGGFEITLLLRENGSISNKKLKIRGYAVSPSEKETILVVESTLTQPSKPGEVVELITTTR